MRWIVLVLAAAMAGGLYAQQSELGARPTSASKAIPAVPAKRAAPSPAVPVQSDARITLTAEQQREATAEGGFRQAPRSLLRVERQLEYGDFEWNDEGVPPGRVTVRMDLRTQLMSVFRGGHEIGTAIALYGADSKKTPLGSFPILWKGRNHRSSIYDAPMPYTLRLTGDGVAIHGSNVRWGAATHGCVGVPKEFARRLFAQALIGDVVTIVRTKPLS